MGNSAARKTTGGDGRVQRGEKNRERIIEALFELVREGELVPTAEQVAERAGVGTRTVFRHFDDMDSLFREINQRVLRELVPSQRRSSEGSLHQRAAALVRDRGALFERIAPFKRSGSIHRWHSAYVEKTEGQTHRALREHLLEVLPELNDVDSTVLEAADMLTGFDAWDSLRRGQKLSRERTIEVMELALHGVLREVS